MEDKEFLKMVAEDTDCPEKLVEMADTPWQKQVAVEFVLQDRKITKLEETLNSNMAWVRKISLAVFGVVVLSALTPYMSPLFTILQAIFG